MCIDWTICIKMSLIIFIGIGINKLNKSIWGCWVRLILMIMAKHCLIFGPKLRLFNNFLCISSRLLLCILTIFWSTCTTHSKSLPSKYYVYCSEILDLVIKYILYMRGCCLICSHNWVTNRRNNCLMCH